LCRLLKEFSAACSVFQLRKDFPPEMNTNQGLFISTPFLGDEAFKLYVRDEDEWNLKRGTNNFFCQYLKGK